MKIHALAQAALSGLVLMVAGCQHLDVAPEGNPERVLNGTVSCPSALPAGAEVLVRVVARATSEGARPAAPDDFPLGVRPESVAVERVLGEQLLTLDSLATRPVPFAVEYRAEDSLLRQGITVEARVSYNGRVRFRTLNAHVVTLSSAPFPQGVRVQPVN